MPNGPVGQQPAAAASRHAQLLFIDVAALDDFIHAGHQVFVVITGIVVLNDVAKLLAIGRAAARIRIQHDVTLCRHPLKFVIENKPVRSVRAAVNVQDERIFLVRIKVRRFLDPGVDASAVETLVPDIFRLRQIEL